MNLKQLFILGNPRSGTSLLRLLLNAHSKITIPPECGFLLWLYSEFKDWKEEDATTNRALHFIKALENSKKFETWRLDSNSVLEQIKETLPYNYETLSQCVYLSYAKKQFKKPLVLGDKNNYYINCLSSLNELFKQKIIIHIVRDGRDVAVSYKKTHEISDAVIYKPNLSSKIEIIATEWQKQTLKIHNTYCNYSDYHLIRYEDLVLQPEKILNDLIHAMSLAFEPEMLNYYNSDTVYFKEPEATMAWKLKTMQPVNASQVGLYKKQLNADDIRVFNTIASEALKQFNYAP